MRRRGVTVLVGAVLVGLMLAGLLSVPVPYAILGAGPTVDTVGTEKGKPVIEVTGAAPTASAGQLRLTTVGVQDRPDLVAAVAAWFRGSEAVVPREMIYPPGRSEKEVDERNAQEFARSQTSAETVALRTLGLTAKVTVTRVVPGSPAAGRLADGDVITAIDGTAVRTAPAVTEAVRGRPVGTTFNVAVTRGGAARTVQLTSTAGDARQPRIGVEIEERYPVGVEIKVAEEIGGPSAGLMFALGIIDKVKPEDLTGGRIIAGTGTIDDTGKVGPIGGIPQKLVGARAADATVFLVPADNCAEAAANPVAGLALARVSTLEEALAALADVRAGRTPPGC